MTAQNVSIKNLWHILEHFCHFHNFKSMQTVLSTSIFAVCKVPVLVNMLNKIWPQSFHRILNSKFISKTTNKYVQIYDVNILQLQMTADS